MHSSQVLDLCIDRIVLHGDTVEQCLAQYPGHAKELEAPLRAAQRLALAAAYTPGAGAKERGRQRLRQEMEALGTPHPQGTAVSPAERWVRRWSGPALGWPGMRASAAFAMALLLFIGAPALVAASGGSVPGETLYPVKRGLERARLALERSAAGKAELHVTFAERRATEMGKLMEQGNAPQFSAAQKDLNKHLQSVAGTVADIEDKESALKVRAKLEAKSAKAIDELQQALKKAPPEARAAASESFQASSQAFGQAVDVVVSQAPGKSGEAPGKLRIVTGTVSEVHGKGVVIQGSEITFTAATQVEGNPQQGEAIVVVGTANEAGDIVAERVVGLGPKEVKK